MRRKQLKWMSLLVLSMLLVGKTGQAGEVEDLQKEIKYLKGKVEQLEEKVNRLEGKEAPK